jgi:hypothetical protein
MWIIDIRHWLDDNLIGPGDPQLRFKVSKLTQIIVYATAVKNRLPVKFQPTCWRRPKRKPCPGRPQITLNQGTEQIHWFCPECGDKGTVTGWAGLIWDMTDCSPTYPQ